tara:strand:- start:513 stop:827 length:315 start_codon:yes stop_codon:yes gene_type:complete
MEKFGHETTVSGRAKDITFERYLFNFNNGYGASVIKADYSYGGSDGLWELAVLNIDGTITYETPITSDVLGYLTDDKVKEILNKIKNLVRVPPHGYNFELLNKS